MKRPLNLTSIGVLAGLVLLISLGCGGGGSGGSATTGSSTTSTTTTGTNTTGATGTTGTLQIVPATSPAQSTITNQTLGLSLNYTGPSNTVFLWSVEGPATGGGFLTTGPGQPFPFTTTSLTQATYNNDPSSLFFGYSDTVYVIAYSPSGTVLAHQTLAIPLASGYTTLPAAVVTPEMGVSLDATTYKPGATVTATFNVTPGLNNLGFTINAPTGFTPTAVTINGVAATLPAKYSYLATAPAFTLTMKMTIPTTIGNEFPVTSAGYGLSGPWLTGSGGGGSGPFVFDYPFFIHA